MVPNGDARVMESGDRTDERGRTERETHVCVFCGETFDVSERTACPSCEATVVLRGRR